MKRCRLELIEKAASSRKPGYLQVVLDAAIVKGDVIEISDEDAARISDLFGVPDVPKYDDRQHADCPEHVTWCVRFGLPAGESGCAVCVLARKSDPEDPSLAPWFSQAMRDVGRAFGAITCAHRKDTGLTEKRTCCGGQVKEVTVHTCGRTQQKANCEHCRYKEPVRDT